MAKQLQFTQEARASLKSGVDKMANAVKTTLGPKGRNVAVDKKFGAPTVTHDGVTVAREIELEIGRRRRAQPTTGAQARILQLFYSAAQLSFVASTWRDTTR